MFPVKGKKREKKGQERGVVRALRLSGDKKWTFPNRKCPFFHFTCLSDRVCSIGVHSTRRKRAASEMGSQVIIKSGKVKV